jgi:putative endonuclease
LGCQNRIVWRLGLGCWSYRETVIVRFACPPQAGPDDPYAVNKHYYVYILANKKNGTLYIGITSNIVKRVWEHKNKLVNGFTKRYDVKNLVYYEQYDDPQNVIRREKRLKRYNRNWKLDLIEKHNPEWKDLHNDLIGPGFPG